MPELGSTGPGTGGSRAPSHPAQHRPPPGAAETGPPWRLPEQTGENVCPAAGNGGPGGQTRPTGSQTAREGGSPQACARFSHRAEAAAPTRWNHWADGPGDGHRCRRFGTDRPCGEGPAGGLTFSWNSVSGREGERGSGPAHRGPGRDRRPGLGLRPGPSVPRPRCAPPPVRPRPGPAHQETLQPRTPGPAWRSPRYRPPALTVHPAPPPLPGSAAAASGVHAPDSRESAAWPGGHVGVPGATPEGAGSHALGAGSRRDRLTRRSGHGGRGHKGAELHGREAARRLGPRRA